MEFQVVKLSMADPLGFLTLLFIIRARHYITGLIIESRSDYDMVWPLRKSYKRLLLSAMTRSLSIAHVVGFFWGGV